LSFDFDRSFGLIAWYFYVVFFYVLKTSNELANSRLVFETCNILKRCLARFGSDKYIHIRVILNLYIYR